MEVLRIVLTIVFIIVSVAIATIILMQEGKSAGLGVISGAAETYWGKNKGRSLEGTLKKLSLIAAILFLVCAFVLNII